MNGTWRRWWLAFLVGAATCGLSGATGAQTLEAPVGGAAIPVGSGLVACSVAGGWLPEAGGSHVRPPSAEAAAGTSVMIRVAPSFVA